MSTPIDIVVGGRVRGRRLILNLSLKQLGITIAMSPGDLGQAEAGERRFSALELMRLTVALRCGAGDLLPSAP